MGGKALGTEKGCANRRQQRTLHGHKKETHENSSWWGITGKREGGRAEGVFNGPKFCGRRGRIGGLPAIRKREKKRKLTLVFIVQVGLVSGGGGGWGVGKCKRKVGGGIEGKRFP